MQRHLGGDVLQRLHLEVRCPHRSLYGGEWMLDRRSSHNHRIRLLIQPFLCPLENVLVFAPSDASLQACRATVFQRAGAAHAGPVAVYDLSSFVQVM